MVPDERDMIGMVMVFEEILQSTGWDNIPPQLAMIQHSHDGESYTVAPFPIELTLFGPDPGAALVAVADCLEAQASIKGLRQMDPLVVDRLAGIMFGHEAWLVTNEQRAEHPDAAAADTPGASEIRQVVGVDCAGRLYARTRYRGTEPDGVVVIGATEQDDEVSMSGRATEALIRVLKAMTQFAPPDSVDRRGLSAQLRKVRQHDDC